MLRAVLAGIMTHTRAYSLIGHSALRRGVVILLYHRVGPPNEPWLLPSVDGDVFAQQMAHLRRNYDLLSLEDAIGYLKGWDRGPRRGVVVTFDDGYADNYHHALPALLRYRIPATMFLTTTHITNRRLHWWDRLRYADHAARPADPDSLYAGLLATATESLWSETRVDQIIADLGIPVPDEFGDTLLLSWDQVREMAQAGIAFGGHTCTHPWLPRTAAPERWQELTEGLEELERYVALTFRPFAYPNGLFDAELEQMCQRAGYDCALTCQDVAPRTTESLYRVGRVVAASTLRQFHLQAPGMARGIPGIPGRDVKFCKSAWHPSATTGPVACETTG